MKKTIFVFLISFIFFFVSSLITYLLGFSTFPNAWIPLILGVWFLIVSVVLYFVFRKKKYAIFYICFFLSSVALGFCLKAWYIFRGFNNNLLIMFFVSLVASSYIILLYLYSLIPLFNKHPNIMSWIFFILSVLAYILIIVFTETSFVSTIGYYGIVSLGIILAMCIDADSYKKLFRNMTVASFSVFIVAIIITLFMLGGDGIDFSGDVIDIDFANFKKKIEK